MKGGKGAQVLVSVDRFSPHTITISTLPIVPTGGPPPIYLVGIAAIVLIIVALAVIWRYVSAGAKKLPRHRP